MFRFFTNAVAAARRRMSHRRRYARWRDWGMSLYDTLLRYGRRVPMPLRGRIWGLRVRGMDRPIYVRLGSSDGFVLEEIFITGVYECVTSDAMGDVKTIVDLGANAGLSVRLWRQRYPEARVIAVEPDEGNLRLCRMNGEDGSDRVRIVDACVAGRAGTVYLDRSAREECAIRMADGPVQQGRPVRAMTMGQILEEVGCEGRIDLLKCDVEGAEREVFADCAGWLARVRSIMIELHPPYGAGDLMRELEGAGGRFEVAWRGITAENELLFLKRHD